RMLTPDTPLMRSTQSPRCLEDRRRLAGTHLEAASASSSNSRKPNRNLASENAGGEGGVGLGASATRGPSELGGTITLMIGALRMCSIEAASSRTCAATVRETNPAQMIARANNHRDSAVAWLSSLGPEIAMIFVRPPGQESEPYTGTFGCRIGRR